MTTRPPVQPPACELTVGLRELARFMGRQAAREHYKCSSGDH